MIVSQNMVPFSQPGVKTVIETCVFGRMKRMFLPHFAYVFEPKMPVPTIAMALTSVSGNGH